MITNHVGQFLDVRFAPLDTNKQYGALAGVSQWQRICDLNSQ